MKVLITGITGFAGGHLTELLARDSYEIYGTYLDPFNPKSLSPFQQKATFYPCDLTQPEAIEAVVKTVQPDFVYHLAGMSHVQKSWSLRETTLKVNLFGSLNLLESLRKFAPSARTLIVSSGEVYGEVPLDLQPISENFPIRPMTPYAVSKASLELLCYPYIYGDKLHIIIVRPFNHTGPRQNPTFVCSDFARQIAEIEKGLREPRIYVGNLDTRRDFSDVRDVVRGYQMIMKKGQTGEIYNIASGKAYAIGELLDILLGLSRVKIQVSPDPERIRPSDIPLLLGDNTKVRHQIGWEPEISIQDTLRDILSYWRERI